MYDEFCPCGDCKRRIALGESTFQTNEEEKQDLGRRDVVVKPRVSSRTSNSTSDRHPFIEYIRELLCTAFGHKWNDDFNCTRCHRELPIWRN